MPIVTDDTEKTRRQIRRRLGLAERDIAIVAPCPMIRQAKLKSAIWAQGVLWLVEHRPRVHLLLPVPGPAEPRLRFYAEHVSPGGMIAFPDRTGPLTDALLAADIALFPAPGAPDRVALGACLRASLPVVAPHSAFTPERPTWAMTYDDSEQRQLPRALLMLIEDPSLREQLAGQARATDPDPLCPSPS